MKLNYCTATAKEVFEYARERGLSTDKAIEEIKSQSTEQDRWDALRNDTELANFHLEKALTLLGLLEEDESQKRHPKPEEIELAYKSLWDVSAHLGNIQMNLKE